MDKSSTVRAILLGVVQDAGVPQIGCDCINCQTIGGSRGWPVSLALVDDSVKKFWIIDATPKFSDQYIWLQNQYPQYSFSGFLITHAHIGHYTGLMYLGREAMSSRSLPVYASSLMQRFLKSSAPWSQLVDLNNIKLMDMAHNIKFNLIENLTITPVRVNHRSEFSDTFGILVKGIRKNLFYCPDIDRWQGLDLSAYLDEGDLALLDGTFFSAEELPGRDLSKIPHPFVTDTFEFVKDSKFKVSIIHLNHSNPLWCSPKEKDWLDQRGIEVAKFGSIWAL